jgi:hypothetical protein
MKNKKLKQISDYFKQFSNFEIKTEENFLFVNYKLSKDLTIYMVIDDDSDEACFYSSVKENCPNAIMKFISLSHKARHLNERVYFNEYDEDYIKELKEAFDNIIKEVYDELSEMYNTIIDVYEHMKGNFNTLFSNHCI